MRLSKTNASLPHIDKLYIRAEFVGSGGDAFGVIDCGSEPSVITMGLVKREGLSDSLIPTYSELQTFGDKTMVTNYEIEVRLKFEGHKR